jgi:hypothetical protein
MLVIGIDAAFGLRYIVAARSRQFRCSYEMKRRPTGAAFCFQVVASAALAGTLGVGGFPPSQFAFDGRERGTVDDVRSMQGLRFIPELARR